MRRVVCDMCGTEFETKAHNAKYCSRPCQNKAVRVVPRDRVGLDKFGQPLPQRRCVNCEEMFQPSNPNHRKFCTRDCHIEYTNNSCPKAHERRRELSYQKQFGMTIADYDRMYADQNGLCCICGRPETSLAHQYMCIDHDHDTGQVRGLLCQTCNRGIGFLGDDIATLESAVAYLKKHKEKQND